MFSTFSSITMDLFQRYNISSVFQISCSIRFVVHFTIENPIVSSSINKTSTAYNIPLWIRDEANRYNAMKKAHLINQCNQRSLKCHARTQN